MQNGEKKKAKETFDFVLKTAGKHSFLGEQIDNNTLKPNWVIGLGWSHAMFVIVLALQNSGITTIIAEKLSQGIPQVRVDFYEIGDSLSLRRNEGAARCGAEASKKRCGNCAKVQLPVAMAQPVILHNRESIQITRRYNPFNI